MRGIECMHIGAPNEARFLLAPLSLAITASECRPTCAYEIFIRLGLKIVLFFCCIWSLFLLLLFLLSVALTDADVCKWLTITSDILVGMYYSLVQRDIRRLRFQYDHQ